MGVCIWSGLPTIITMILQNISCIIFLLLCNKLLPTWQLNTNALSHSFTAWRNTLLKVSLG